MEEPPLNAAHIFAAQAEEYAAKGQIERAAEAHRKAAENYLKAQENTENSEALQALSLLHAQHLSKYQHYSTLPKPTTPTPQPRQGSTQRPSNRPKQPSRQRSLPKAFHSVNSSTASIASTLAHARAPPIREEGSLLLVQPHRYNNHAPSERTSPPSSQEATSPTNSTTSSTSDPFDKFYTSLQEMLSRLSHPLAFATAPLDGTTPEYGGESFFVVGDEGGNTGMGDTIVPITRSMAATMLDPRTPNHLFQTQTQQQQRTSNVDASQIDPRDSRKTLEEYAYENRQLKLAVDSLSKKVASYKETAISSSSLLKNSMAHLRAVHHQTAPSQPSSLQKDAARIKELEDEVRRLTVENLNVKLDLEKAQRRWERLKEGARRRRRDGSNGVAPDEPSIPEVAES